ncbi:MAG: hypothetical protein JWO67_6942 [Streptosporangiaceae bacterium]|nr:hypothetical protein [Streptosporangiaceae bacterium]
MRVELPALKGRKTRSAIAPACSPHCDRGRAPMTLTPRQVVDQLAASRMRRRAAGCGKPNPIRQVARTATRSEGKKTEGGLAGQKRDHLSQRGGGQQHLDAVDQRRLVGLGLRHHHLRVPGARRRQDRGQPELAQQHEPVDGAARHRPRGGEDRGRERQVNPTIRTRLCPTTAAPSDATDFPSRVGDVEFGLRRQDRPGPSTRRGSMSLWPLTFSSPLSQV